MTPIGTFKVPGWEDLNPVLEKEIFRQMKEESGQVRSNVGGWHSADTVFKWSPRAFDKLRKWVH